MKDLAITVRGEIVSSNYSDVSADIESFVNRLNLAPATEIEFGEAQENAKTLKAMEKALDDALDTMLEQAEEIYALKSSIEELGGKCKKPRLILERAIKARREDIREDVIRGALTEVGDDDHWRKSLETAAKGKRTLESLKKSVGHQVEAIKIGLRMKNDLIDRYAESHGKGIAYDRRELLRLPVDTVKVELKRRVERIEADAEKRELKKELEAKNEVPAPKQEAEKELPDPPEEQTIEDEWRWMEAAVKAAFANIKQYSRQLQHPENKERISGFADAVNEAWKAAKAPRPKKEDAA